MYRPVVICYRQCTKYMGYFGTESAVLRSGTYLEDHKWGLSCQDRGSRGPRRGKERVESGGGCDRNLCPDGKCAPFLAFLFKPSLLQAMEEGTRTKKTVFVGGISDDVDESKIYENFSTFGAIPISTFARCILNFHR